MFGERIFVVGNLFDVYTFVCVVNLFTPFPTFVYLLIRNHNNFNLFLHVHTTHILYPRFCNVQHILVMVYVTDSSCSSICHGGPVLDRLRMPDN